MLPGFRSLFVAVVLAISMLIFGLGAAALLRATHEEFASLPLKQMPEVTFGSGEAEQPTLAVLQVATPAAEPAAPGSNPTEAQHTVTALSDAQPEAGADAPATDALPATDASAAPTAASLASSDSLAPAAGAAVSADTAAAKPSEPLPDVEVSVEAGNAVKPDIAKTDATKSDVTKTDVASDVAETMTSPFGEHSKPPLPVSRPVQETQVADPTPPTTKRSSAKPPRVAKRHHHRRVIRQSRRSSQPVFSRSQFDLD